jgi:hypothetical protein
MATSGSTIYPKLLAADPSRPSLADLPLEIMLQIIEALFDPDKSSSSTFSTKRRSTPSQWTRKAQSRSATKTPS